MPACMPSARRFGRHHKGTEVWRLGLDELTGVYEGFTVANHTLTHPRPDPLPIDAVRREVAEGRARLQALFKQPVHGFVCPFGAFNDAVARVVRDAGHHDARITGAAGAGVDTTDPLAAVSSCHFLAPDFRQRLDRARARGVFCFWGHSYEPVHPR
jgi:peptidoglycan-N-acetylglucosamine deacetylase